LQPPSDQTASFVDQSLSEALESQPAPSEQHESIEQVRAERASDWLDETWIPILRATRSWIQYGTVGFAVICILIGAVEGLFGH
jgi:hypothetical protein